MGVVNGPWTLLGKKKSLRLGNSSWLSRGEEEVGTGASQRPEQLLLVQNLGNGCSRGWVSTLLIPPLSPVESFT